MDVVEELIWLSRRLGEPSLGLAILAEGNASANDGDEFLIKGSGFQLATLGQDQLSRIDRASAAKYLTGPELSDSETREALNKLSPKLAPSVETFMHAELLGIPAVQFVAHCHPTALLSLLCTSEVEQFAAQRLFPDEVVCCGPASVFIPYTDPGLPLAREVKTGVEKYVGQFGEAPKTIWLENHGLITLGSTAAEAFGGTLMSEKAAKIRLHALASGLPIKPLSKIEIDRIHTRPDEHYRQQLLRQLTK
ncbi:MAG TPA: class II aldolase/adducin family protein [Fimbriimonadaceae bacterium]|nr:class II aldolase/adducin family protein [Fimbriimonadaceae bacterium]